MTCFTFWSTCHVLPPLSTRWPSWAPVTASIISGADTFAGMQRASLEAISLRGSMSLLMTPSLQEHAPGNMSILMRRKPSFANSDDLETCFVDQTASLRALVSNSR